MWVTGVDVEQETSAALLKRILDPPLPILRRKKSVWTLLRLDIQQNLRIRTNCFEVWKKGSCILRYFLAIKAK